MLETSFLKTKYRFYDNRIEVLRKFPIRSEKTFSLLRTEGITLYGSPLFFGSGRCFMLIHSSGGSFLVPGIPAGLAESLCGQYIPCGDERASIRISNRALIKNSILKSRIKRYFILLAILWATVLFFGGRLVSEDQARSISEFAFRRTLVFGALVLSLALPQAALRIWAITGGVIAEFIRYYRYTAVRYDNAVCFEYGSLLHRRVYIPSNRICAAEYYRPPLMQLFGAGNIRIFTVGYNTRFMRSDTVMPYVKANDRERVFALLLPEFSPGGDLAHDSPLLFHFMRPSNLIPAIVFAMSLFAGHGFAWIGGALLFFVFIGALLTRRHAGLTFTDGLTCFSCGSFYARQGVIRNNMIEYVRAYGPRFIEKRACRNYKIRVFGMSVIPITVRCVRAKNISDTTNYEIADHQRNGD